jgi:sugar lactone lactonase YvrE
MLRATVARTLTAVGAAGFLVATFGAANASPRPAPPAAANVHPETSVTKQLNAIVTIGSTVDPINGDQNPYGLAIAPVTAGAIHQGDLIICNFNDGNPFNIQGLGTTIEDLSPVPGSSPTRISQDPRLTGCDALALDPKGFIWAAALDANDNPIVSPSGSLVTSLPGFSWGGPWGQAYSGTPEPRRTGAFYESNSLDGSIVRINLTDAGGISFTKIVTGFPVNHGVPGTILGPSGLTYDMVHDVLFVVDGMNNTVYSLFAPGKIVKDGITIAPNGSVGGPSASARRVVFSGAPLNAPISAALLYNGNLVVGNTTNNRLVEISTPYGRVLHTVNLDTGAAGALFGIVATGTSAATTKIYFNDDNTNTVDVLEQNTSSIQRR